MIDARLSDLIKEYFDVRVIEVAHAWEWSEALELMGCGYADIFISRCRMMPELDGF